MKRTILSTAVALALTGAIALAQAPQQAPPPDPSQPGAPPHEWHHRHPSPEREAARISKALNLSPDQTAKLEPIFADRDQKMAALWQNQSLAPQDRHEQMRAIQQGTREQLATVLTPDQIQQLKTLRHEHGGPHGPGQWQGHGQPPAPPSGL
jgi:Spy/CpxP family protein refolding chaperone